MVSFENCKDIAIHSFFKGKNETKENVLNKSQSLVKIFRSCIFLVFIPTMSIPFMFTKNLYKSFDVLMEKKVAYEWMHDYAKEHRKHGEVKSTIVGVKGNNVIW